MYALEKDPPRKLAERFSREACSDIWKPETLELLQYACDAIAGSIKFENESLKCSVDAIFELSRGIGSLRTCFSGTEAILDLLCHSVWENSLYPCLRCCFFSPINLKAGQTYDKSTVNERQRLISVSRDALFKSALLPLVLDGMALQKESSGLTLAHHMKQIRNLAEEAAETIGWRVPEVEEMPFLRNYGLVNVLWSAVQSLWAQVPTELKRLLESQEVGADALIDSILKYLSLDAEMVWRRQEASDVKLLQFWLVQLNKILVAYPDKTRKVFSPLRSWSISSCSSYYHVVMHADNELPESKVWELSKMVKESSLWGRSAKLQLQCLDKLSVQDFIRLVDVDLVQDMDSPSKMVIAAQMLGHCSVFSDSSKKAALVPLLKHLLSALSRSDVLEALKVIDLDSDVSEAIVTFILSCHNDYMEFNTDPRLESEPKSWEESMLCLLESSLHPHPVRLQVLSSVWSYLMSLSDERTASHLIDVVYQVICSIAEAQMVQGVMLSSSHVFLHLIHLLAAMLSAVPHTLWESFVLEKVKLSPSDVSEHSKIAQVSSALWAAVYTEEGRRFGTQATPPQRSVLWEAASTVVRHICEQISFAIKTPMENGKIGHGSSIVNDSMVFSACECLVAGLACCSDSTAHLSCRPLFEECLAAMIPLVTDRERLSSSVALAAIAQIVSTDSCLVKPGQLNCLEPRLEEMLRSSRAAPFVARVASAYKIVSQPPRSLYNDLLGSDGSPQSPSMRLLGLESYIEYVRGCEQGNMLQVLPKRLMDPSTKAMASEFRDTIERHLKRLNYAEECKEETMQQIEQTIARYLVSDGQISFSRLMDSCVAHHEKHEEPPPSQEKLSTTTNKRPRPTSGLLEKNGGSQNGSSVAEGTTTHTTTSGVDSEEEDEDIAVLVADVERAIQKLHRKIGRKRRALSIPEAAKLHRCLNKMTSLVPH